MAHQLPYNKSKFEAIDTAGGQTFTDTDTTLVYDSVELNENGIYYDSGNGESTIIPNGLHFIHARIGVSTQTGSESNVVEVWIERDSGSGFSMIPGTKAHIKL